MSLEKFKENSSSYELYKEIAEELCVPVDEKLSTDVRYELYNSKLVYLRNLYDQCFRCVNQYSSNDEFTATDLAIIREALEVTKVFMRNTILESLNKSLAAFTSRGQANANAASNTPARV